MSFKKPAFGLTAGRSWLPLSKLMAGNVASPCRALSPCLHGRSANRWGPAQLALKELGEDHGAHEEIDRALAAKLAIDQMPESSARFLSVLNEVA